MQQFLRPLAIGAACAALIAGTWGGVRSVNSDSKTPASSPKPTIRATRSSVTRAQIDKNPLWSDVTETSIPLRNARQIVPSAYRTVSLNRATLDSVLATAPREAEVAARNSRVTFSLPMPDGRFDRFHIVESPIMDPKLAAKYPNIRTYLGQGIDDPTATLRFDVTHKGFHAQILSAKGTVYIDPFQPGDQDHYISYAKRDYLKEANDFICQFNDNEAADLPTIDDKKGTLDNGPIRNISSGPTLRTFRLAMAATGEYTQFHGGTVADGLAAIVSTMNRVNGIYEREVAVRMVLVANTDQVIYTNGATDPYTNNNGSAMLGENQTNLTTVIGSANYDIGHVFSTGGGGIASLGSVCSAGNKARGVTGSGAPVGDAFDVDFVAHEMGHQFNCPHTFNSTAGSCSGNRSSTAAYETGSGTTIMAYAGICGIENLQPNSDDYFHRDSLTRILNFVASGCATTSSTGNNPPTVSTTATFTIPANTPFTLTASGSDPDSDPITYLWEEFDLGGSTSSGTLTDTTTNPLFRPADPVTSPSRTFPSLRYILNNANAVPANAPLPGTTTPNFYTGELLPTTSRTLNFRVTVRDNRAGGGGTNEATSTLTVTNTAGPFNVTAPNTAVSWAAGSNQVVTWNVANTTLAPVSTAQVRITLSLDGGYTYPVVLAAIAPNNGNANVTIPADTPPTTQARVRVEAVGNIFFDVSDANFTITDASNGAPNITVTGSLTTRQGSPTSTVAVATLSNPSADINALSVSVSQAPPELAVSVANSNGTVSLTATAACTLVAPTSGNKTYPVLLTVTDIQGGTSSAFVNVLVGTNSVPTLGAYTDQLILTGNSVNATPSAGPADANNNFVGLTVTPTTLPGGGTVSINQTTGVVSVTTTAGTTQGSYVIEIRATDTCGATEIRRFTASVQDNLLAPVVTSPTATGVTATTATLGGNVVNDGGSPVLARGVVYAINSVNANPTIGGTGTTDLTTSGTTGVFTVNATGLTGATTYAYRAYATNVNGTTYTTATTFTTVDPCSTTFNITFDAGDPIGGLPASTTLSNQYAAATGVTFSPNAFSGASSLPGGGTTWATNTDMAVVTNTGQGALGTPTLVSGNILHSLSGWQGENGDPSINMTFANAISTCSVDFCGIASGVNGTATRLIAFDSNNNVLQTTLATQQAAVSQQTLTVSSATPIARVALVPGSFNDWVGIDNIRFTLVNNPCGCTYAINPTSTNVVAAGGTGSVTVTAGTGCAWTAVSNDAFITVTGGASGSGNGTVNYSVAANTGPSRTGTITIAGQTFTVNQDNGCSYSINPTSNTVAAGGGTGSVTVTTATGCAWTAVSNDGFITVTGGATGSGNGTVNYSVAANGGPARTGTITIAGQTFTVNQGNGCSFVINPTSNSVPAGGGTGSVTVTTATGCTWTAVSNDAFITVTGGASGSGNGTVNYSVAANSGPARTGTITIAGQTFTVNQGTGCSYVINPTSNTVAAGGGTGSVTVTTATGCTWTAVSNDAFITVTGGASGSGNGTVNYSVAANSGPARTGTITIAGQTFTVNQGTGCSYVINPTSNSVAAGGGTGSVTVTAGTGCGWAAVSNNGFITVTGGATGSGNGTVTYSVAANTGPARSGTIIIAEQTFTVNQDTGCSYSINPTSNTVAAGGGTGSVTVTTATGCAWTAVSNDGFITVTGGATGSGNGTVNYSVAANSGPARTGTITIAGQTFTVNQGTGCSYVINPTSNSVAAGGGTGSVTVTTATGCTWTAVSNDAFITVTGGATGSGNGTVNYSVAANSGPARTGTITIAGQTFTVNQGTGCSYVINPTSNSVAAGGGTGSVTVTTATGCTWTAVSNDAFITVTGGASGSGNGTVNYSVAANSGPARTGTITIAGQTFTVNQGSGCSYVINPTSNSVPVGGGTGSINVTSVTGCIWTAVSNDAFIIVTGGAAGSGNGVVTYSVAANTGAARSGTITVAGQTFTVFQDGVVTGGCGTPTIINSLVSFSGSGSLAAPTCGAQGYSNDYVLNATVTNISSQTLCSLSLQVVELSETSGTPPAVPFRLISADGATCSSGGLVGSVQTITTPTTLAPGQSANLVLRIAMPSARRFRFTFNIIGGIETSSSRALPAVKSVTTPGPINVDIDLRRNSVKGTTERRRND